MPIDLPPGDRHEAVAALQRFAADHLGDVIDEPLGNLDAGHLLDFFLAEIAPSVYNSALRDAQALLSARLTDLDIDLGKTEFPESRRFGNTRG